MIVAKFGGSSVKNAESMKRCAQIIEDFSEISLVILSATYNTTNELDFIFNHYREKGHGPFLDSLVDDLIKRHQDLETKLLSTACSSLEKLCSELRNFISSLSFFEKEEREGKEELSYRDYLLAFGERLSTTLFYHYLKEYLNRPVEFVKSYDYLKTDSSFGCASYKEGSLENFFRERYERRRKGTLFVAQGYIGSDPLGRMTTLGREGSDYSAALYGAAIKAKEVIIWTDVPGIFSSDPNLVPEAYVLERLSYSQAKLMASVGAKVLYPKTMLPLERKGIPLRVKSTFSPEKEGSFIGERGQSEKSLYAIATEKRKDGVILSFLGHFQGEFPYPLLERSEKLTRFLIPADEEQRAASLGQSILSKEREKEGHSFSL